MDMISEVAIDAESAEKAKSFLEENIDAESLEYARKAYEKNNRIDDQTLKKLSEKGFNVRELEKLKITYDDLKEQRK